MFREILQLCAVANVNPVDTGNGKTIRQDVEEALSCELPALSAEDAVELARITPFSLSAIAKAFSP